MTDPAPKPDGDSMLFPMDRKFWTLHQHVLLRFGLHTIFKYRSPHVPNGARGLIQWFVPEQASNADEVVEWLRYELAPEYAPDRDIGEGLFPGTDVAVQVMKFRGLEWHVERDVLESIGEEIVERLLKMRDDDD